MNHLPLIIKREYINKVRNKSFILMTFLSPLIMVGIFSLVAYLSQLNNEGVRTISVLDQSGLFIEEFENTEVLKFNILSNMELSDAKKQSELTEDYGLLFIPNIDSIGAISKAVTFYSEDSASLQQINDIEDAISDKERRVPATENTIISNTPAITNNQVIALLSPPAASVAVSSTTAFFGGTYDSTYAKIASISSSVTACGVITPAEAYSSTRFFT
jgi:ABC-type Na+ efflux pump permease subunit